MKKSLKIILAILIIIVLMAICLFFLSKSITANAIKEQEKDQENKELMKTYSYTKAICNSTHCQDYEITCNGDQTQNIRPITGAAIQIDENWKDPRDNETKEKLC